MAPFARTSAPCDGSMTASWAVCHQRLPRCRACAAAAPDTWLRHRKSSPGAVRRHLCWGVDETVFSFPPLGGLDGCQGFKSPSHQSKPPISGRLKFVSPGHRWCPQEAGVPIREPSKPLQLVGGWVGLKHRLSGHRKFRTCRVFDFGCTLLTDVSRDQRDSHLPEIRRL